MTATAPRSELHATDDPVGEVPVRVSQARMLEALALSGSAAAEDPARARAAVESGARRRRRMRAGGMTSCAVLLLVGALMATTRDEVRDVRADAADRDVTTTTAEARSTSTTAVPVAPAQLPTTSLPLLTTTTAPVTTVAPTSVVTTTTAPVGPPPNTVMTAELEVVTPTVEAGGTATVRVRWNDPDFADPLGPRVETDWGDPVLGFAYTSVGRRACDEPGSGGSGTLTLQMRYATPGDHNVVVDLTGCDGRGAYGERRIVSGRVLVTAPVVDGAPGRAVVALADVADHHPDEAEATYQPTSGTALVLDARDPALELTGGAPGITGRPTVLRLPAGASGTIVLRWTDGTCRQGAVDLSASVGTAAPVIGVNDPCP